MLRFGPYEVHEEIGRGGMGVVYRGFDPLIQRDVALKTIKLYDIAEESERRLMQDRLEREAQSAGRLSHPSIVTIYQIGYEEIRPGETIAFIAMEYVAGWTLATVLGKTRVTNHPTVLRLLRQAAEGLDYAHSQGVVHRDVKPANLLITSDGRLKIADFGLAKLMSHTMTMTGTLMGSPFYMSPEQVRAGKVDGRSDQYALAVVAYEVFGGQKPYQADTLSALVYKIAHEDPPALDLDSADLAGRLNPVLRQAMSKAPDDRFASCVAFVDALEGAYTAPVQPAPQLPPPPAAPSPPLRASKLPATSAAVAAALAVVAIMMLGIRFLGTPESPPPETAVQTQQQQPRKSEPAEQRSAPPKRPLPKPPATDMKLPSSRTAAKVKPAPASQEPAAPAVTKPAQESPAKSLESTAKSSAPSPAPLASPEPAKQPPAEPVRTPPKLLQQAPAAYTTEARAAGIEGIVQLSVDLNEQGIPIRARVLKPLDPGLDRSAVQSLAGWRFQPATENGKPVGATVSVEVNFNLIGGPSRQRPSLKTVK